MGIAPERLVLATIVLVGHAGHEEVESTTMGEALESTVRFMLPREVRPAVAAVGP